MNYHGGNIYEYEKAMLDFSANINPLGVPESFKKALAERLDEFTRYPDIRYTSLRKSIAGYLGMDDPDCILPGNGAVDVIYTLIQAVGRKKLFSLSPTFSEYGRAALGVGMEYEGIAAYNEDFSKVDINKLMDYTEPDSILILCNPNNPTGHLVDLEQVQELASGLAEKNALLIVDEAFMEFTTDFIGEKPRNSMVPFLKGHPNTAVIKAATKFFGMPGLRLGYGALCNPSWMKKAQAHIEPWNINTAAVIAGDTVLHDKAYIHSSRAWILEERPYVLKALNKMKQFTSYTTETNYYLLKSNDLDMDAWKLKERLAGVGILIRTPDGFSNLSKYHFRLAILDRERNNILLEKLAELFEK